MSAIARIPRRSLYPAYWISLSTIVAIVDYLLGPHVQFPIVFVIPVGLAAWYSGLRWGLSLAVILPAIRLYSVSLRDATPWNFEYSLVNAAIRVLVLAGAAYLLDRLARQERVLEQRVETLEGLLPICSRCKNIRDERQEWHPLEEYISERTKAEFTHGLCPSCVELYFAEQADGEERPPSLP
jgi:hypothetical protein